ncbi:uncharacterized protein K02A2.6-like [Branchiostoma floridae]|uniref:ribonuclease H n=1 Tax=Branchiostoma floridae TaxID=7739 RepID=A0A9J7LD62_BRAFL|nr:uncharacterized protein K02A2.6-like [Branchiostoma floridae]
MAEGSSLRQPACLDVNARNLNVEWKKWKEEALLYIDLTVSDDAKKRRKTLRYLMGDQARKVHDTLTIQKADNDGNMVAVAKEEQTVEQIVEAFDKYCNPKQNETIERYKFFTRAQQAGEAFDAYATHLRNLAKYCGFGAIEESVIRDRIICGINDAKIRERLLREKDLTLDKCEGICRTSEISMQNVRMIGPTAVHAVQQKTQATPQKPMTNCRYCGKRHRQQREACPAYGKQCLKCKGQNHFAKVCKSADKKPRQVGKAHAHARKTKVHALEEDDYVMTITDTRLRTENTFSMSHPKYAKQVHAKMKLEGRMVNFQLDLGATCNVMPKQTLLRNKIQYKTSGAQRVLKMYNNSEIVSEGETDLKMINPKTGKRYVVNFVVIDSDSMPLLGANAIQQIGVVTVHYDRILAIRGSIPMDETSTVNKPLTKESLIQEYKDVFTGLGRLPGECHLETDDSITPKVHPPRRVPVAIKEQLKTELDRMTREGVIEPVTVPTPWVSSLVTVRKPSGKLRICIDPRDLNKALKGSHYPAPTIEDIIPELSKAKVFSVLDAKNGYWQVALDEESSVLTTFNTPNGRYKWKRLPFGIKSSQWSRPIRTGDG